MSASRLIIEADGGSRGNPGPAGFGAVVIDAESGDVVSERAGYLGEVTNNVAEYRGLIAGLQAAREIGPDAELDVRMDSKLVVEQMSGRWKIKHADMKPLAIEARRLIAGAQVTFTWIPRERNSKADALANEAMDSRDPHIRRDHDNTGPAGGPEYDDAPADHTETPQHSLQAVDGSELVSPLTLVLVRHGVTDMTVAHKLSGSSVPGPPLNAQGRVQAAKAADAVYRIGRGTWESVPRISRVYASPMTRTQDTAAAIGRRVGSKVVVDDRVREVDFGDWEGLTGEEVGERVGDAIHQWRFGEIPAPGGESMSDVATRFDDFLVELAREHAQLCAAADDEPRAYAVASHAVAIKSCVGLSLQAPTRQWGSMWPQPASMTMMQLRVRADGTIAERHILCVGAPT